MRTVKLYGHLAKKFGRVFEFDIQTPAQAVAALQANFKDFKQELIGDGTRKYHVFAGKEDRGSEKDLGEPCAESQPIKIIPVVEGRSAGARVVGGAVLFVVGAWMSVTGVGASFGAPLMSFGLSLMMGGLAELMAPDPQKAKASYTFNGAANSSRQGDPVPIGYGMCIIGGSIISAEIDTVQY